jgi:hypothetical protein
MRRIGAGLFAAAALLTVFGILKGGPPPGFSTSNHIEWIEGLLFFGACAMLVSGCLSGRWLRILLPPAILGAVFFVCLPVGVDPNPMPPAIIRYGYPLVHGVSRGCVVARFPGFNVESGLRLLIDAGLGALAGSIAGMLLSVPIRAAVDDSPSCPPPSPLPSGSSRPSI